jgi:hypothetical protein
VTAAEVIAGPGDQPAMVQRLREQLGKMVGLEMQLTVTARGLVRDVQVKMPPDAPPELVSMMDGMRNASQQATATFPREPVGVGARWRVESSVDTGTLKMQQVAHMKLAQRPEGRAVIALTIEQTAPPQPMRLPMLPAGASATLESYAGHGQGQMDVRLDTRIPQAALTVQSKTASTVVFNEARQPMNMDMTMDVKIAPGPPPR